MEAVGHIWRMMLEVVCLLPRLKHPFLHNFMQVARNGRFGKSWDLIESLLNGPLCSQGELSHKRWGSIGTGEL
jgi:hypothetical protein